MRITFFKTALALEFSFGCVLSLLSAISSKLSLIWKQLQGKRRLKYERDKVRPQDEKWLKEAFLFVCLIQPALLLPKEFRRKYHRPVIQYIMMLGVPMHNPTLLQIWIPSYKISVILYSKFKTFFSVLLCIISWISFIFSLAICCSISSWQSLFLISLFYIQFPLMMASSWALNGSKGKTASEP